MQRVISRMPSPSQTSQSGSGICISYMPPPASCAFSRSYFSLAMSLPLFVRSPFDETNRNGAYLITSVIIVTEVLQTSSVDGISTPVCPLLVFGAVNQHSPQPLWTTPLSHTTT